MLSEIAFALASTNDKYYFYLDLQTGAVVKCTETIDGMDIPFILHAYPDRLLPLPRKSEIHAYGILEGFLETPIPDKARKQLRSALDGESPFKRFRQCVQRAGLEEQWEKYKDAAYLRKAEEWCQANRIIVQDTGRDSANEYTAHENGAELQQSPGMMAVGLIESIRILHRALDDNSFEAALDHLRDAFSRYV